MKKDNINTIQKVRQRSKTKIPGQKLEVNLDYLRYDDDYKEFE